VVEPVFEPVVEPEFEVVMGPAGCNTAHTVIDADPEGHPPGGALQDAAPVWPFWHHVQPCVMFAVHVSHKV